MAVMLGSISQALYVVKRNVQSGRKGPDRNVARSRPKI